MKNERDTRSASPERPNDFQHFKLISEGGTHRAQSPGTLSCQDALWNVRDCTTTEMKDVWRRSQSGCSSVPADDRFMFTLPLQHVPDLDQGKVSDSLRREFKENGITLSGNTGLTIEHMGRIWLINDKEHRYSVRMLPTNLFVYTELQPGDSRKG
jgi:hypothetical protein